MADNIVISTGGGGTALEVQKDDSSVATGVSILNFEDTGAATLTVTDDTGGKVTVSVDATESTQDLWETIAGDTGSTAANSPTDTLTIAGGTGISTAISGDTLTITNSSPNVDQNLFQNIAVAAQSTVVADSPTDTLTLVNGTGIAITTNAGADSITITNTSPNVTQNLFQNIAVATQSTVVADNATDTLTLVAGTGIGITTNATTDTITFARTSNLLSRHNGTATQTFGTTQVTILFGTSVRNDSNYTYNAGEVTINTTGWYKITYDVTADNANGGRTTATYVMQNNTVNISGSVANSYHRNSANGEDTATATFFANLTATNVIRVRGSADANVTTVAQGCRLTMEYIG